MWWLFIISVGFNVIVVDSSMLIGLITKDAALLSSTSDFNKNGVAMRADYDWIKQIGTNCLVGLQGDSSDCDYVVTQIESINRDNELTYADQSLSCRSIAHLFRRIIANNLRTRQLRVCALIAGWDHERNRPVLFWLDSIGSIQEVPYGAHGDEFPFVWSLLDRKNRAIHSDGTPTEPNPTCVSASDRPVVGFRAMDVTEATAVVDSCMRAARKRTMGRVGNFRTKCVTIGGCKELESG